MAFATPAPIPKRRAAVYPWHPVKNEGFSGSRGQTAGRRPWVTILVASLAFATFFKFVESILEQLLFL